MVSIVPSAFRRWLAKGLESHDQTMVDIPRLCFSYSERMGGFSFKEEGPLNKRQLEKRDVIDLKKDGASFWDSNPCGGNWSNYNEFMVWIRRTEPYIYGVLDKYAWKGKRVVEVGCGQGTTLNHVAAFGAQVYGLDMSIASLQVSKAGSLELGIEKSVSIIRADAECLPFPDNSFDVAISVGVLHHTPNPDRGIREIHRVLNSNGKAIVMLYHSGNPKWWATRFFRGLSALLDGIFGQRQLLARQLRKGQSKNNPAGTALLELFGVPILKAFSNRQARRMFSSFRVVHVTNYSVGFARLVDIVRVLRFIRPILRTIDRHMRRFWGFYQVIEAEK